MQSAVATPLDTKPQSFPSYGGSENMFQQNRSMSYPDGDDQFNNSFTNSGSIPYGRQDVDHDLPPQISGDLDDISSQDEEIHHIEIKRDNSGFGFSIRGGAEYGTPLYVLRIAPNGAAEKDGRLRVRDVIYKLCCIIFFTIRLEMSYWRSMVIALKGCFTPMLSPSSNMAVVSPN